MSEKNLWSRLADTIMVRKATEKGEATVKYNMYILATFMRTLDYRDKEEAKDDPTGYRLYANLRSFLCNEFETTKFIGLWRRDSCFMCNCLNCDHDVPVNYATTVIILCELTDQVLSVFKKEERRGSHRLKIDLYPSLSIRDARSITGKIRRFYVKQKMSKYSKDWNDQCKNSSLKMEDNESGGAFSATTERSNPPPEIVIQEQDYL